MAQQSFPNPLGVHALVWVGDTSPASVEYAVAKTKETGYDLLELSLHDTATLDVAAARCRLTEAGLRVVCSRGLAFDAETNVVNTARQALALADDIGENHRGYLGSGHLDFTAFFHALTDIDYTGPITFESFSSAVIAAGLSNDLAIWRNLWSDGEDLARHARAFIANHLTAAGAS
jgi:sugar phosphate isomerase/epimerase